MELTSHVGVGYAVPGLAVGKSTTVTPQRMTDGKAGDAVHGNGHKQCATPINANDNKQRREVHPGTLAPPVSQDVANLVTTTRA